MGWSSRLFLRGTKIVSTTYHPRQACLHKYKWFYNVKIIFNSTYKCSIQNLLKPDKDTNWFTNSFVYTHSVRLNITWALESVDLGVPSVWLSNTTSNSISYLSQVLASEKPTNTFAERCHLISFPSEVRCPLISFLSEVRCPMISYSQVHFRFWWWVDFIFYILPYF